jgi:ABC-2 type transport system permease protein
VKIVNRAVVRVAGRLTRTGALAAALIGAAIVGGTVAGYPQVAGTTAAERAALAAELAPIGDRIGLFAPAPVGLETAAGYLQWRAFGGLPFLAIVWALLAGVAATRGDEERGRTEQWLATGTDRATWLATRAAAFAVSALGLAVLSFLAGLGGAAAISEPMPVAALAFACLGAAGLATVCFAVVILAAQFATSRRSAFGIAGAALGITYLVNGVARMSDSWPWWRWLSPFAWYDANAPLRPGGAVSTSALAAMVVSAVALTWVACTLFARRDLGAPVVRVGRRRVRGDGLRPASGIAWRMPLGPELRAQRAALLIWPIAAAGAAAALGALAKPLTEVLLAGPLADSGATARLLAGADPLRALFGTFLFGALQLVSAMAAIALAGHWAADDQSGRLEFQLAQGLGRSAVVVRRVSTLAVILALIVSAGVVSASIAAAATGVGLAPGALLGAAGAVWLFGLAVGAVGILLSGWLPRAAAPGLAAFVAITFMIFELGLTFGWPAWVLALSPFEWTGRPLAGGLAPHGLIALLGLALAGSALAAAAMRRRDLAR